MLTCNFVHTCFLKPSLLLKALCIVIMAKHVVLLLQTLLDCWHCLLSIHQPVSSSSLVWKGSTRNFFFPKDGNAGAGMIRFSNAFLCFVQVASSSEREMVGSKIYCSYQCHRMGKLWHIWKACLVRQKDIYNHCKKISHLWESKRCRLIW